MKPANFTLDNGSFIGSDKYSITAGIDGPILLKDTSLIEKLQRFTHENIPERVVHAHGVGAFGKFVSTKDISHLTHMSLFTGNDKETPLFTRFSTTHGHLGSPEPVRDFRGFAVKFYTEDGNWDLVSINSPVFFLRDPHKFPDLAHVVKSNPVTNVNEITRILDFFSLVPESIHALTYFYSDIGIPASYRNMDGHSINAYKFVKNKKVTYVKFNWKSLQGVKNFTVDEAAAANYKANTIDLYNAIDQQNFPSWELQIQTISPDDFDNYDYDLLDATKQWLDVPFETIGVMTLNKNPDNVFQQTEQSVFKVSNFIYGIEASEDRILQARLFVMPEASFYRVGINNHQLPINRCPFKDIHNYNQNGASNSDITTSSLNYSPSHSIEGYVANKKYLDTSDRIHGKTVQKSIKPTHNFTQAGIVFRRFSSAEQGRIITNLSNDLNNITNPIIKLYMVSYTYMADINYGTALALAANVDISTVQYFVQNYKQN